MVSIHPLYSENTIKVIQRARLFRPRKNFEDIFDDHDESRYVFTLQGRWKFSEDKVKVIERIWSLSASAAYSGNSIVSIRTWIRELTLVSSAIQY